jgi:hypothetical protein
VLQCIADEVGRDLRQPLGIPHTGEIAFLLQTRCGAAGKAASYSRTTRCTGSRKVRMAYFERNATREPCARQIEHVIDHARHASAAYENALGGSADSLIFGLMLNHMRGHQDRAQRVAQIVSENRREHLVEPQSLGLLPQLSRELLLLAIQPEENGRLVLEDVWLDGLVQEIHGAAFISLEQAMVLIARGGGDEDDGYFARALAAAHELGELEAIHFRHLHVEQGERDVVHQQ